MEYVNGLATPAKEESEFKRLLSSLRQEASISLELSNHALDLANTLQQMPEAEQDERTVVKEQEIKGVLETFWHEVYRVRKANFELQRAVDHLQKIIG